MDQLGKYVYVETYICRGFLKIQQLHVFNYDKVMTLSDMTTGIRQWLKIMVE